MSEYAIRLNDVSMIYKDQGKTERTVLDHISLDIKKGEFISLLGPSGCGKTTLLRMIADLLQPVSGTVTVNGMSAGKARKSRQYGMVFQSPALLPWRTVIENTALPLELQKVPRRQRLEKAEEQLELVGLAGYESSYPHKLSGGMQQRVGIARALSTDPDILLMDEPFSALDEFTKERLHGDLLKIWKDTQKTIVFVTHNISEAVLLSDRVCVLSANPGRLAAVTEIHLPRPRGSEVLDSEAYFEEVTRIHKIFEEKYHERH